MLLLLMLLVTRCGGDWIQKPQDTSQHLNLSVTFNCSAGDGSHVVIWSKEGTGILFVNTDSFFTPATQRMRAVAIPAGVSLTLTSLERSDDGGYKCEISDTGLSHTATLTVLGRSFCISLSVCLSVCASAGLSVALTSRRLINVTA